MPVKLEPERKGDGRAAALDPGLTPVSHPPRWLYTLAVGLASVAVLSPEAVAEHNPFPSANTACCAFDGRTDVLCTTENKLERLDGRTLAPIWKRLTAEDQPSLTKLKTPGHDPTATLRYIRRILTTCPDLNGDGKGDCVFGLDFQPDLVAVNGTNGEVLWWHRNRARPDGMKEGPFVDDHTGDSFVLAEPLLHDVDGDGVPDLITGFSCAGVTFRGQDNREKPVKRPAETLIQAVSGRSGKLLWSRRLEEVLFSRPGGGSSFLDYSQTLGTWKGDPVVTVLAGGNVDAEPQDRGAGGAAGEQARPQARRTFPEHARFFDPDGTGELAVLILTKGKEIIKPGDQEPTPYLQVAAVRTATGEVLWEVEHEGLKLEWRPQQQGRQRPRACDWPAPFRFSTRAGDKPEDVLLPFRQRRKEIRGRPGTVSNVSTAAPASPSGGAAFCSKRTRTTITH